MSLSKSRETDLVPTFLLIVVQRVQVCDAGRLEELVVSVCVMGTVPTVSTNTAHFFCREARDRARLQKARGVQKNTMLEIQVRSAEN